MGRARQHLASEPAPKSTGLSWEQCLQQVDTCLQALTRVSLREYCIFCQRLAADEALCDRLHVQSSDSRRLRIAAAHLAEETRHAATLARVQPGTTEYDRCCQAATGSVDVSLFDGSTPFSDMRVLDVHRLANAHCSAAFAEHSQAIGKHVSSRVKGMFVSLPPECMLPLAARGWHPPSADPPGLWDAKGQFLSALRAATGMHSADASLDFGTYAQDAASAALPLPVRLSRHSAGAADAPRLRAATAAPAPSQHEQMYCDMAALVAKAMPLGSGEAPELPVDALRDSLRSAGGCGTAIRYLCLCRVELADAVPCEKYAARASEERSMHDTDSCVQAHSAAFAGGEGGGPKYTPPLQCSCSGGGVYVFEARSLVADYVMQTVFTAGARDVAGDEPIAAPPCLDLGVGVPPTAASAAEACTALAEAPLHSCTVLQSAAELAMKWSDIRRRALEWRRGALSALAGSIAQVCFGSRAPSTPDVGSAAWGNSMETFHSVLLECLHSHVEFSRLVGSFAGSQVRQRIKGGVPPPSSLVDLQLPSPPPIVRFWKTVGLHAASPSSVGGQRTPATETTSRPKTGNGNAKPHHAPSRVSSAAASTSAARNGGGHRRRQVSGTAGSDARRGKQPAASGRGGLA